MLYYCIDHKVGAVGVLCPQAKKGVVFALAYEAQFRSNKTNVRSRKASAVFSVASDGKNNLGVLFGVECLFCLIGKGQYLACLVKCVGAKCTKRSCRVQQWSAQRFSLCVLSLVESVFTPNS